MDEKTLSDIWNQLDETKKNAVHEMVGEKLQEPKLTVEKIMAAKDILKWFAEEQKKLIKYILGECDKI